MEGDRPARRRRPAQPWAAEARYYEGELIFREYEKVTLDVKPAQLEKALKPSPSCSRTRRRSTSRSSTTRTSKWATAALYRVGQVYDGFAESLVNAPHAEGAARRIRPQAYRDALDAYVVDIQGKAVEVFTTGYQKAIQMQVYDEYTAKIREALGRLAARQVPARARGRAAASASAIVRRRPSS